MSAVVISIPVGIGWQRGQWSGYVFDGGDEVSRKLLTQLVRGRPLSFQHLREHLSRYRFGRILIEKGLIDLGGDNGRRDTLTKLCIFCQRCIEDLGALREMDPEIRTVS